ncbi:MAG: signal peptidase II, partial [Verrucomicrobiota bacterium]
TLFTLGVGAGLAVLAAYLVRTARMDLARFIGFSLVMAGGIGNLIDRVVWKGVVTDFAVIHVGPVHTGIFNIADVLVLAGAALALYSMGKKEESNPLPNQ